MRLPALVTEKDQVVKFGTLYAYWTNDWTGDYMHYAKKVADLGFDILEISAGSLLAMSPAEIDDLKALMQDSGRPDRGTFPGKKSAPRSMK